MNSASVHLSGSLLFPSFCWHHSGGTVPGKRESNGDTTLSTNSLSLQPLALWSEWQTYYGDSPVAWRLRRKSITPAIFHLLFGLQDLCHQKSGTLAILTCSSSSSCSTTSSCCIQRQLMAGWHNVTTTIFSAHNISLKAKFRKT